MYIDCITNTLHVFWSKQCISSGKAFYLQESDSKIDSID